VGISPRVRSGFLRTEILHERKPYGPDVQNVIAIYLALLSAALVWLAVLENPFSPSRASGALFGALLAAAGVLLAETTPRSWNAIVLAWGSVQRMQAEASMASGGHP